jgi:hypothetical protein
LVVTTPDFEVAVMGTPGWPGPDLSQRSWMIG